MDFLFTDIFVLEQLFSVKVNFYFMYVYKNYITFTSISVISDMKIYSLA